MNTQYSKQQPLIEAFLAGIDRVPEVVDVVAVTQFSIAQLQQRHAKFLNSLGVSGGRHAERGEVSDSRERTVVGLPRGARAMVMHASGAMKYQSGMGPTDAAFTSAPGDDELTKIVSNAADQFGLSKWSGVNASIDFEHLWKIKGQAVDMDSRMSEPTLFRALGAFRHSIGGIPVLGPASATFSIAGDGILDSATLHIRESAGETIDEVRVRDPKDAAVDFLGQLTTLAGRSELALETTTAVQWTKFGYFSLSKRAVQRLLEPVYASLVNIRHDEESQGYLLLSPAAEKSYLPWCRGGAEAYPALVERTASARIKKVTRDHQAA